MPKYLQDLLRSEIVKKYVHNDDESMYLCEDYFIYGQLNLDLAEKIYILSYRKNQIS